MRVHTHVKSCGGAHTTDNHYRTEFRRPYGPIPALPLVPSEFYRPQRLRTQVLTTRSLTRKYGWLTSYGPSDKATSNSGLADVGSKIRKPKYGVADALAQKAIVLVRTGET